LKPCGFWNKPSFSISEKISALKHVTFEDPFETKRLASVEKCYNLCTLVSLHEADPLRLQTDNFKAYAASLRDVLNRLDLSPLYDSDS
jgi:hypothetical protein